MRLRALLVVTLVVAAAIMTSGCAENRTLQAKLLKMARTPVTEMDYEVAPPDQLSIEVKGYPEYSRTMVVRPDGKITVPSVGDMHVQGMTIPAINAAATEALSADITSPNVTVSLTSALSKAIFIMGEVRRPGRQPYFGDMTLVDAIGAAGSVTLYANSKEITITRADLDDPEILCVNLQKLVKEGAVEQNLVLREGDLIHVPPTILAKIGYAMDQLLFPFRAVVSGLSTYGSAKSAFDDNND